MHSLLCHVCVRQSLFAFFVISNAYLLYMHAFLPLYRRALHDGSVDRKKAAAALVAMGAKCVAALATVVVTATTHALIRAAAVSALGCMPMPMSAPTTTAVGGGGGFGGGGGVGVIGGRFN
jgi:NAD(P)H-dependent FMN reductase